MPAASAREQLLCGIFQGFPESEPPDEQAPSAPYLALFASFLRDAQLRPACANLLHSLLSADDDEAALAGAGVW